MGRGEEVGCELRTCSNISKEFIPGEVRWERRGREVK